VGLTFLHYIRHIGHFQGGARECVVKVPHGTPIRGAGRVTQRRRRQRRRRRHTATMVAGEFFEFFVFVALFIDLLTDKV
jgi:hypothetical protein